jgi:hypothetical protein
VLRIRFCVSVVGTILSYTYLLFKQLLLA